MCALAASTAAACARRRHELWLGGIYREIVPHKRLVMTHVWDDENGKPGPKRWSPCVRGYWRPYKVTLEQTGFTSDADRDGHREGWSECLDLLAEHLATMR